MYAAHRLADFPALAVIIIGGAPGVIEDDDAGRAAFGLHQGFHFRIIDPAHFILIEEVAHAGLVAHETKAIAIECEVAREGTAVVDTHLPRVRGAAALSVRGAWSARIGEY